MTDLKGHFDRMLADEPAYSDDIEPIVAVGRQARRRRRAMSALAGGTGVAVVAAVVIPIALASAGHDASVIHLGTQPPTTPAPVGQSHGHCRFFLGKPLGVTRTDRLHLKKLVVKNGHTLFYSCPPGARLNKPAPTTDQAQGPQGPRYHYSEDPAAISQRLGKHLSDRIAAYRLTVNYTRPFAQESSALEHSHPTYFGGNVDIKEAHGYGDIGVQVTHAATTQVPPSGSCNDPETSNCVQTTLPDGSTLQTAELHVGRGDVVMTAEVDRPDGLVVQAQQSNYAFGPDAGNEVRGSQPLTLDQLVSLAEDPGFSF